MEIQEYLAGYRYKIELHAHTSPCSGCSEIPPKEMIRLMKAQGYDAVVITNHFLSDGYYMDTEDPVGAYMKDFAATKAEGDKQGIKVLLGAEYRFTENINDYLVYGIDEAFLRKTVTKFNIGIEAFYKEYHRDDLLIIQAHPFRNGMTEVLPEYLDGIETMNLHPNHNSRVAVATRYAGEQKFPVVTIGTDLHHFGHEGGTALRTKVLPENEKHLVEILRSRDYLFEVGGCPVLPFAQF